MDLQLSTKTALVTGASVGIGNAIARALAAEGVQLCIMARRRPLLEELAGKITAAGGRRPHIVDIDMMEADAPARLARAATEALGRVDILVNSAGGSRPAIPMSAAEVSRAISSRWLGRPDRPHRCAKIGGVSRSVGHRR